MAGTRYLRYIIFSVLCLTILFFISSSSAPTTRQVSQHVQTASDILRDKWKVTKPFLPGTAPSTGNKDVDSKIKEDIKQEIELIPQPSELNSPPEATSSRPVPGVAPDNIAGGAPQSSPNIGGQFPAATAHGTRMNATFVTLARNGDVWEIAESIRQVEDRFNHKFHYDWVFLNEQPFDDEFIRVTSNLVSGTAKYGLIGDSHWSFPSWIDQKRAQEVREDMGRRKIIYGDSISYRHMCRFESGFFFRQPLMMDYEWYWRVEPSIKLYCDVDYDVFKFMADNKKKYSFVLSLYEYKETIPTLWDSVKAFIKDHPEHIAKNNSMWWLSDDKGDTYNHCHFWSNFEIGNLNWLRSKPYLDFFEKLDKDGGFFYERWGDAPVHSIAASLMLQKDEIHFFNDIGYWHVPFHHCPSDDTVKHKNRCHCNPDENFDWNGYSCTARWYDMHGMSHPEVHNPYRADKKKIPWSRIFAVATGILFVLLLVAKACLRGA